VVKVLRTKKTVKNLTLVGEEKENETSSFVEEKPFPNKKIEIAAKKWKEVED